MAIDFEKEWDIDMAATDGFRAGKEGTVRLPYTYAGNDLLSSAWFIGNRLALSEVRGYQPGDSRFH